MESNQERINDIANKTGATEAEVRVLYYLQEAAQAWNEVPQSYPSMPVAMRFHVHHRSLTDMVLARIARRDHPEGWQQAEDEEAT